MKDILTTRLNDIKQAGTWKNERVISTPQKHQITSEGKQVLNFCANNYLGLSDNPQVYLFIIKRKHLLIYFSQIINAAKKVLETRGFGMSSVRFICGTQVCKK